MLRPDDDLPSRNENDALRLGADAEVQAGGSPAIVVEPGKSVTGAERNFGIDLLRGAAILLVVLHHLALNFRLPLNAGWIVELVPRRVLTLLGFSGYEAVYVFFVLSGFLIAHSVQQKFGAPGQLQWRAFYLQRASRILPLLIALLALLSVLHLVGLPGFVISRDDQSLAGALFSALTFHLNWYEGQTGWLPGAWDVLWSLSIEEVFYLSLPWLCLLLPRSLRVIALAMLVISLPWTRAALDGNAIWQEKAYLPGMSAIALGVLTAWLSVRWTASRGFARALATIALVGLLGTLLFGGELWRLLGHGLMLLMIVLAAALILALHWLRARPLRGLGWLARMGQLSYEIYLFHMFVVLGVTALALELLQLPPQFNALMYPPSVALCMLIGSLIERYFSTPMARWTRRRFRR